MSGNILAHNYQIHMLWVSDPEGYDVFRTVPLSLEYQFFFPRIVYTCLEDHCFYLGGREDSEYLSFSLL